MTEKTPGIRSRLKALCAEADVLAHEHSPLMFSNDHDGAAHCQCELAQRYRVLYKKWEDACDEHRKNPCGKEAAQSEELTRLRAEYKVLFERSSCEMSSLERELASVKEALRKYGRHADECMMMYPRVKKLGCDCGFSAALNPETKP